jgi:hypothetical protein
LQDRSHCLAKHEDIEPDGPVTDIVFVEPDAFVTVGAAGARIPAQPGRLGNRGITDSKLVNDTGGEVESAENGRRAIETVASVFRSIVVQTDYRPLGPES